MAGSHDVQREAAPPAAETAVRSLDDVRPAPLSTARVLALQRSAGNAAVSRYLAQGGGPRALSPGASARATAHPAALGLAREAAAPVPAAAPAPTAPAPAPAAPAAAVDPARRFIADYARRVPGYSLVAHAIGADPITGEPVRGSLLREVIGLIPGGAALMERLEQSGAIERASAWLSEEVTKLDLTYERIADLFGRAWDSISAWDLIDPGAAWERLSRIFDAPIARVRAFAERAAEKLFELSLEAMLAAGGGAAEQVLGVLRRAGQAFGAIVRDPLGFASNLVAAVRGGFSAFADNLGAHLQRGLIGWLTGALGGVIQLPQRLDFEGIVSLVTQILGLTWERVRARLVRLIGERRVAFLERTIDFVRDIAQRGLGAAWERIMEFAGGLADQVLAGIRDWIAESVVGAAIRRLATMFNPAGAIINAVLAVYNTIEFVIERARQIGELVDAVSTSISEIASGAIGRAVNAVEQALGRAVPVALGFLAQFLGLGDVGERVRGVVERIRATVDGAIDRVIDWIRSRFAGGAAEQEGDEAPEAATAAAEPHEEFDLQGEEHTLYLVGEAEPVIEMASGQRENILVKLDRELELATTPVQQQEARQLRDTTAGLLARLRTQTADSEAAATPAGQSRLARLANRLDEAKAAIVAYARKYNRRDLGAPQSGAGPQDDAAMVQGARAALAVAQAALAGLPPAERAEKTYAAGGGLTRLSGWGANSADETTSPAEGQRLLEHRAGLFEVSGRITRAIWNGSATLTNPRTGEVRQVGLLPGTGEAEEIERAFASWDDFDYGSFVGPSLPPASSPPGEVIRPVSGDVRGRSAEEQMRDLLEHGSTVTRLRIGEDMWQREIRVAPQPPAGQIAGTHVPLGNQSDMSVPGQYSISHAEQQVRRAAGDVPIGVTRPMCSACQNFFRSEAARANKTLVVADTQGVRLFRPSGDVETA
jgi:hypothetical protein